MQRRAFLTVAAALAATRLPACAAPAAASPERLVDTNVSLSRWPVRATWAGSAGELAARLRRHGVTSAWTGSLDGVLHTDLAAVNAELATACAQTGPDLLLPFGTVNPTLPDWTDDVRRCAELHGMRGLRLFPNYHGYELDDPRLVRLLELAAARRLVVQITVSIEDDRSQNPALQAPPVQVGPLFAALARVPEARVMLLNAGSRILGGNVSLLQRLVGAGVTLELATLEGVAGIAALQARAPGVRLAFGSHAPYFYFEAALLKLQESALSAAELAAVHFDHAEALLAA